VESGGGCRRQQASEPLAATMRRLPLPKTANGIC